MEDKRIVGRQIIEANRFIERAYFEENIDVSVYFAKVKEDPKAWKLSRMHDGEFGATDIELKILNKCQ